MFFLSIIPTFHHLYCPNLPLPIITIFYYSFFQYSFSVFKCSIIPLFQSSIFPSPHFPIIPTFHYFQCPNVPLFHDSIPALLSISHCHVLSDSFFPYNNVQESKTNNPSSFFQKFAGQLTHWYLAQIYSHGQVYEEGERKQQKYLL